MKKFITLLLVLTGMVSTAMAGTETTVYYAVPYTVVGSYTVKLNVNFKGDGDDWHQFDMTKTADTYLGYPIYSCTYTDSYNGVGKMQFQLYDGSTWKSEKEAISGWTSVSTYNGKMYVYQKTAWLTKTVDNKEDMVHITYHVQKTNSWTPSNAYEFDNTNNNGWPGVVILANPWNDGWYDYTVTYPFTTIIFDNGNSGDGNQTGDISINKTKDEYWTTYVSGTTTTVDRDSKPEGWIDYKRTSLTEGNFGTICLPYNATVTGATVFKIVSKTVDGESNLTGINLESVETLEAGKAYIYKATGTTLTATYSGSYSKASDANGMMGNLEMTPVTLDGSVERYVVGTDNKIHKVVSGGDGVTVGQYKGYITLTGITTGARGLDYLGFADSETTGIETVQANQAQNGEYYNLAGQRVAQPTKGLYIVNGKKVIIK